MQTLNADLKSGEFKRVYLLFGDEGFLKKSYKNRLKDKITGSDTMNYNYYEGKGLDVNEIIGLAETMPFFAEKRLILIEDSGFFKSASEELASYLPSMPETTCLLFVESEVDKRSKLYKAVKKAVKSPGRLPACKMGGWNPGQGGPENYWKNHGSVFKQDWGRYGQHPHGAGKTDQLYHGKRGHY